MFKLSKHAKILKYCICPSPPRRQRRHCMMSLKLSHLIFPLSHSLAPTFALQNPLPLHVASPCNHPDVSVRSYCSTVKVLEVLPLATEFRVILPRAFPPFASSIFQISKKRHRTGLGLVLVQINQPCNLLPRTHTRY